jgi:hypothetical protein
MIIALVPTVVYQRQLAPIADPDGALVHHEQQSHRPS